MEEDVYKIAIAAFMHDMGKFAERGGLPVSQTYMDNNSGLYQPYIESQKRHTHRHSIYTAAFIEKYGNILPGSLSDINWGMNEAFVNLAAGHHKPETPLQWIVAVADRVSSGFDRDSFDDYNKGTEIADYKKVRLLSILESAEFRDYSRWQNHDSYHYRYPLKELSPLNIFPDKREKVIPVSHEIAEKEYEDLFNSFVEALGRLAHRNNIPLWFEHFENLYMIYTSHIPAATVGKVVPDVSLYDHSKITSAVAVALYKYHLENQNLETKEIREDYESRKFLLINGDFYGIQSFIFSQGGSTDRFAAKLLRGRSFAVSLLTELGADLICRNIGIPAVSVILNAAGKFTILAQNTAKTRETVEITEKAINDWLTRYFYGEVAIGISCKEASCEDFLTKNFSHLWESLHKRIDEKKFDKIDLESCGGVVPDYLDSFVNTLKSPLCPFCGKRPSDERVENDGILKGGNSGCAICRDHVFLGENLVKRDRLAVLKKEAAIRGPKLCEPVFGTYQISFESRDELEHFAKQGTLLKFWDISIPRQGGISRTVAARFINGYVPVYSDDDLHDERILHGRKSEKRILDLIDMMEVGQPKSFNHIAKMALLPKGDKLNAFAGTEALGVLKADVDNLGLIFGCGISEERHSLSRFATLSRQINNFFSLYLPHVLSTDNELRNIYTIFCGGDDLFLLGPWNSILGFAARLRDVFREYVCHNDNITISAGISVHKPGNPVAWIAESAEEALGASKSRGRDSITLFGQTAKWSEFRELSKIKITLQDMLKEDVLNNAMLFRLNVLSDMAKQDKQMRKADYTFIMEDFAPYMLWRSLFKYSVIRNVGRKLRGAAKEEAINRVLEAAIWLQDYDAKMRIPLWQIIYNNR